MNDETNTDTRPRAHAHTRGSGLRPSQNVISTLSGRGSERERIETNILSPSSLTENLGRERALAEAMMGERGIEFPDRFIDCAPPGAIIGACRWWDQQGERAKVGLLIWKIRGGGVPPKPRENVSTKTTEMRARFDDYVVAHPVGSQLYPHIALAVRKWPNDKEDCVGQMIVVEASYPVLEMECDMCGFEASLTPRAMKGMA